MPTFHRERTGPFNPLKRQTNDPLCSDVRLGFFTGFGLGFGFGLVVVVVGTVEVVDVGVVVDVTGVVVDVVVVGGVVVVVVVVRTGLTYGTKETGR